MSEKVKLGFKVELSENQLKVIKSKYLRDAPSVEHWLWGVAENIALAELLYEADEKEIFKGVKYEKRVFKTRVGESVAYFLHAGNNRDYNDLNENFKKFINNLYELKNKPEYEKVVNSVAEKFFLRMARWEFLPNSPTLMNAGRDLQQLSACYVLPVEDSIEGIFEALKNQSLIHKSGGGTGFSFSRLRPENDVVRTTKGVSSGPISFMQLFDKSTEVVKQGGTRRGANMGILRYDHPDIMKFITMKQKPGVMENFNVSVTIDDYFMQCVKEDKKYWLINPRNNKKVKKIRAKEVWEAMIDGAWKTGDPGFVVIDRINNSKSNPTPELGEIESTNPCGEQPLLPYEPCNLGSINVSKFVLSDGSDFDWVALKECVHDSVRFLDNVIDVNNYPLAKIEELSKTNRRIGLGVMGWGDALVKLKIPYDSEKAFNKARELMKFINVEALKASEELAKVRGVFPNFDNSIYDKKGKHFMGVSAKPRNCARTTIAPTGTIGMAAGCDAQGIEPFFAIAYVRYDAQGLEALRRGETPSDEHTFFYVNKEFKRIAAENNYFGLTPKELWRKIEANHKSVRGISEIPVEIQKLFPTSHDISPEDHVKMQAAFQEFTDNAVSKTVNLRNEATREDVERVYWLAYNLGCKGVTVYRDGSKDVQVLNINDKSNKVKRRQENNGEKSVYYQIETGYGPLHVHINYDDLGPTRVFTNIAPLGTEISGLTAALGILISKYLELGGDAEKLLKHLNSIKGDKPFGFGRKRVESIPHAISKVLRDHLLKTGKLKKSDQMKLNQVTNISFAYCPKCYSTNVAFEAGCSEPTCYECGYSKCS